MKNGVFIDSNIILHHLAGNLKAKKIIDLIEKDVFKGHINQIVVSEVIFIYVKLITKLRTTQLKSNPGTVKSVDLGPVYDLFDLFHELNSVIDITISAKEVIQEYGLLSNDALIAATCKHHGIKKIATFDGDFKRVEFLEVVDFEKRR